MLGHARAHAEPRGAVRGRGGVRRSAHRPEASHLPSERSIFAVVRIHAGTSGFSYDKWHGRFYPADLPAAERLGSYSSRLATVEINNTFYQTPKAPLLEKWSAQVPAGCRFALKGTRRIK